MPRLTARERPVLAFGLGILIALLLAISLVPAIGGSSARAEEESPQASEEETPQETPQEEQCSSGDSAGPLPQGSWTISGTVTDQAGVPGPLGGIQVRFTTPPSDFAAGSVMTEADGSYTMGGLGDGTYLVSFFDASGLYQNGFHGATGLVPTPGEADPVVLSGASAVLNAALPYEQIRNVQGTVTDSADLPVGGILLTARSAYFPMVACDTSLSDGSYAISGVRTMAFRIGLTDPTGAYPDGFYSHVAPGHFTTNLADATILTADVSDMTGVDIQLPAIYTLSGVVHDDALAPVAGVDVSACISTYECGGAVSDENGAFTIVGLVAGDYLLGMDGSQVGYLNGWYDGNGAFTRIQAEADPVTVADDVTGLDLLAVLAPTANGTIRNGDGVGLGGISISLSTEFDGSASATTNSDGTYTSTGLQPGTYTLQVSDQNVPPVYPTGYLGDLGSFVVDLADATQIVVDLDNLSNLSGLDVEMPDGGSVQVSVVSGGIGVPDAQLQVCSSEFQCQSGPSTDGAGDATMSALYPGSYYVQATADYETYYWYVSDVSVTQLFGAATQVAVAANAIQLITITLPSPGTPTPDGTDVEVPLDDGSGTNPVLLTFENVETGGTTSLTIPSEEPAIPGGFKFGEPPTYYEITTTATLADGSSYTICVTFDPLDFDNPAGVRLFHFASEPSPGAWEDTTLPGYPLDGVVCGEADSFSPVALVEREYAFAGFFGVKAAPQLNEAKAGDLIGIQFGLGGDVGLAIFESGSPSVERVDCISGAAMGGPTAAASGSPALKFNAKTQRYTYQWKTDKAWKNTCQRLVLTFRDGSSAEVLFRFKK